MSYNPVLDQEKAIRQRSAVFSQALLEGTWAILQQSVNHQMVATSPPFWAARPGKIKVVAHRRRGSRIPVEFPLLLFRRSFGYTVFLRKYQLAIPQGSWVDLSQTAFPLVVNSYNKWVVSKINSYYRLPWTRPLGRLNPESESKVRIEAWVDNGVEKSFSEIPYLSYHRSFSGTTTPGFGKIKKKDLPVNDYSLVLQRRGNYGEYVRNVQTDMSGQVLRDDQFWWNFSIPGGDTEPSFTSALLDKAVKRLSAAAQSNSTSNVALNIAQIQLTVDMIARSAQRISGSLSALRRGNFVGAAKILWRNRVARYGPRGGPRTGSSLAANWLELQYGWKPLLSDIRGAMEALARYNYANAVVRSVTASASRNTRDKDALRTNDAIPTTIGYLDRDTREVVRYGARFRLASPLTAFLAQTGFTNPVNLAWELLPFSFVVDWFLPIGPYLETLSQWDGLEFIDGFQVQFLRKRLLGRTYFSGTYLALDPSWHTDRFGSYYSLWVKHTRLRLISPPSVNLPKLRHGLNTTRALNALALLRVVFGR
jgi:hypothetical protein